MMNSRKNWTKDEKHAWIADVPFCGGKTEYAGISSGHIFPAIHTVQMYLCKECGYHGSFIIEVDNEDDARKITDALHMYSDTIKTPQFNFPDKWKWLWKLILLLIVAGLVLEVVVLVQLFFTVL